MPAPISAEAHASPVPWHLTGTAYAGADLDDAQVNDLLQALLDLGARNVVLKCIDRNDVRIRRPPGRDRP